METVAHIVPRLRFLPVFSGKPHKRTHLSRLSCGGECRLHLEQLGQAAQVDGEHGQRKHIGNDGQSAQLGLPYYGRSPVMGFSPVSCGIL